MDEYSDLESLCQDMKYGNLIKYKFSFVRPPYKYEYDGGGKKGEGKSEMGLEEVEWSEKNGIE